MPSPLVMLHLGLGFFHRAHQALYIHRLIESGDDRWALAGGNTRPDMMELMASLAKITSANGGEAIAPEELNGLLRRIKEQPRDREVATETKFTPWDRPEFFLMTVGLLCGEWYLRKRWGLV